MIYVLVGAIAAAAGIAAFKSATGAPRPVAEPAPVAAARSPHGDEPREDVPLAAIEGEVLEIIEVQNYSYLRLGAKGTEGVWTAVPTANLAVGARARVIEAMKMSSFKSTALGRTFPVIWFGVLEGAAQPAPRPAGTAPHGGTGPHGMPSPHGGTDPHGGMASPHDAQGEVKPMPRAAGPNGKTVAEVNGQRTELAGKTVRIQGTVVKVTAGVLGKTYLHLRDGSGDAAAGTNDITVTTEATPALGSIIVVEGTVAIDRDIGSGYRFATLVEGAKIVGQ